MNPLSLSTLFVVVVTLIASSNTIERNEAAAVQTLLEIADAQRALRSSGAIDTDGDTIGEYGYFGELSGVDPVRINDGMNAPATGLVPQDLLSPAYLPQSFGNVRAMPSGMDGGVIRNGYAFQIFLPDYSISLLGAGESVFGGAQAGRFPGSDHAERYWCAYAFPISVGVTGQRAFCINQTGDVVGTSNHIAAQRYTFQGIGTGSPYFSAAYSAASMSAPWRLARPA